VGQVYSLLGFGLYFTGKQYI